MRRLAEVAVVVALDAVIVILFVPSLFFAPGVFMSGPRVSVTQVTCVSRAISCSAVMVDTGTADTRIIGCSISYHGSVQQGEVAGPATVKIAAGSSAGVTCTPTSSSFGPPVNGSAATGSFAMDNGGAIPFSAAWS